MRKILLVLISLASCRCAPAPIRNPIATEPAWLQAYRPEANIKKVMSWANSAWGQQLPGHEIEVLKGRFDGRAGSWDGRAIRLDVYSFPPVSEPTETWELFVACQIAHELGHAAGLEHVGGEAIMNPYNWMLAKPTDIDRAEWRRVWGLSD